MITLPELEQQNAPIAPLQPFWADPLPGDRHPRLLLAALGVGVLTAVSLSLQQLGLANALVGFAGTGVALAATIRRGRRVDVPAYALMITLVGTTVITTAVWAVLLCWLAAGVVLVITLTGARSLSGMIIAALVSPFAGFRGIGLLGRSLPRIRRRPSASLVGSVGLSVVLVVIFGALFASGDAVFAAWTERLVPRLDPGTAPLRMIVGTMTAVLVFTLVVLAVLPLDTERYARVPRRTVRRLEWALPTTAVAAVFVIFLLAQARALFGGPAYLRSLGLSYAEYVHQGFGQLVVATVLVLAVVRVSARRAAARTVADRAWRRSVLGGLCVLALIVAASALHRLFLYDQAYGATRLRLLVAVFEIWVAIVLGLAATVCVRLRGTWVPRVAVLIGAVLLAGLGLMGPDRWVAERNVDRLAATGRVDWLYLRELTAEAVPALDRLPAVYRECVLSQLYAPSRTLAEWNLAAARVGALPPDPAPVIDCSAVPSS